MPRTHPPRKFHARSALVLLFCSLAFACSGPRGFLPSSPGTTYRYDTLPEAGEEDAALADYRAISHWDKLDLTFYFINGTGKIAGDHERELVRDAFGLWEAQTPLTFTVSNRTQADILIGWATGEHGFGEPFDGPGDVLAHASYPNPYADRQVFLFFDDDERWVDDPPRDVDLLTVAAHEIGHTLGLDHSRDSGAIMYPSYSGIHRFLSEDDAAGIQSLYGVDSQPEPAPEVPPAGVTPPPSDKQDSDADGISDDDEVLRTGTDPNNEDTDGDGLGDGVEVIYRMNPLDADMDKDGVNDGQEVANGSNPFFPDQSSGVSPELEKQVSDFLTNVIELEMQAYRGGDATLAASVLAGDVYAQLEDNLAESNRRGFTEIAQIDYYQSYIDDIRVVSNSRIDVNTCEVWSTAVYRSSDGALIESDGPTLIPQTITIQKLGSGWAVTAVQFFDPPAFCR